MSEHSQPILSSLRDTVKPGVPLSTTISEIPCAPASPVRTAVTTKSARTPDVMYVFAPLTTYWSPSRFAVVRIPATSEPPSGSVIASEPISSPARVGRTQRSICAGSPAATMCGNEIPEVNRPAKTPPDAPA